jgi:hypothetical protein
MLRRMCNRAAYRMAGVCRAPSEPRPTARCMARRVPVVQHSPLRLLGDARNDGRGFLRTTHLFSFPILLLLHPLFNPSFIACAVVMGTVVVGVVVIGAVRESAGDDVESFHSVSAKGTFALFYCVLP